MDRPRLPSARVLFPIGLMVAGIAVVSFLVWPSGADLPPGFLLRTSVAPGGEEVKYALYVPKGYSGREAYPLIVYLHGQGERGTDGLRPLKNGLASAIRWSDRKNQPFPAVVLFPQGRSGCWLGYAADCAMVMRLRGEVEREYNIDPRRVYLTGISNGGSGTWEMAAFHPNRWAAIAPVCGAGDPSVAPLVQHIPCWCFHGVDDRDTPVELPRKMIQELRRVGGKPKYTEYPKMGHGVWDNVYHSQEFWTWFLSQRSP